MTSRWIPITLLALASFARAEPQKADDPIGSRLFPPELIMKHQGELGIDERQREAIVAEVQRIQAQLVPMQWQMQGATEQLASLLAAQRVDEGKVLAQADKVMALEREFKRAHLSLLIRVRNLLSDAQRARLAELRKDTP